MYINLSLFAGMLNWPERPWVLLITIPALIIGIIPFLRLNKKRRASSRHLIPFIIHMALILILSLVVAGVSYTESYTESQGKVVMFLVDMSDSSAPTKDEMNDYMHEVMSAAKSADKKYKTETQFGLVVFGGSEGNGVIKSSDGKDVLLPGSLDSKTDNFLDDYVKGEDEAPRKSTNIKLAIEKAQNALSADMYKEYTKKVILLSDGKETNGNAYSAASALAIAAIDLSPFSETYFAASAVFTYSCPTKPFSFMYSAHCPSAWEWLTTSRISESLAPFTASRSCVTESSVMLFT